jgi:hypothetical protein
LHGGACLSPPATWGNTNKKIKILADFGISNTMSLKLPTQKGMLKRYSTCLASAGPGVKPTVFPKKENSSLQYVLISIKKKALS